MPVVVLVDVPADVLVGVLDEMVGNEILEGASNQFEDFLEDPLEEVA